MKQMLHTGLATLLMLCLGYAHCTGGLLAIPYAFAEEPQIMSLASDDQFSCFAEVLMSFAVEDAKVTGSSDSQSCDDGSCTATIDVHSSNAPTLALWTPTLSSLLFSNSESQISIFERNQPILTDPNHKARGHTTVETIVILT